MEAVLVILVALILTAHFGLFYFLHVRTEQIKQLLQGFYTFGSKPDSVPDEPDFSLKKMKPPKKLPPEDIVETKQDVNEWLYGPKEDDA